MRFQPIPESGTVLRLRRQHAPGLSCLCLLLALCCGATSIDCAASGITDPQQIFERAVGAQQRGDDATAIRDYSELLRMHPEAVAVRVNLGATLAHSRRYKEAIEQYRMVLVTQPHNKLAEMNLALAYHESGQMALAIPLLERLHRGDPEEIQTALLLADCYVKSSRARDAVALLKPLDAAQPGDADTQWLLGKALIQAGQAPEGVELVEKAARSGANASAWLFAGQTRLEMSQFDVARKDADETETLEPNLPGLETLLGMIEEQTADYDSAETSLLKAVATDDKDFDAHYSLGALYYFRRDMEKAKEQLVRALELRPASAQARFEMALAERAGGELDAALHDLERVAGQSPGWLEPHVELSALYYRMHRPEDGAKQKAIVSRLMAEQQKSESQGGR